MLMSFWKALKLEHFTEDIHSKTKPVTTIKPAPGVGNYSPRLRREHFPPAQGYAKGGDGLPSQELPQQPGMVDRKATATATSTVPPAGHSDPRRSRCGKGEQGHAPPWLCLS